MKKFLVVLLGAFLVLLVVNRQKLFLRDPLGRVERNGMRVAGAQVYINYSNDVLVEDTERGERYLVQRWNMVPGLPTRLGCVKRIACWTEGDRAGSVPLGGAGYHPKVEMSNREVSFVDGDGVPVKVTLR
jgi:hypothetical protein